MNRNLKQQDDGFTIIEVVPVLAIAALIMLMVFLALPALQRGQRDTTRKNDVSRLQSAINNYKSTNRGSLPTAATLTSTAADGFTNAYMRKAGDQFADPSGSDYVMVNMGTSEKLFTSAEFTSGAYDTPENSSKIYFSVGASCDFTGGKVTGGNASARKIVLVKGLEGGGVQCVEA